MLLGERLRKARADRGLFQTDFAEAFGVNQATICRIERGDSVGGVTARLIELQLDRLEHDNPLPVVGMGEPPTGSAREEAAMPRGQAGTGTRGKRTAQKRSQNSGNSQAGFPAAAHKQLNAFGKKLDTLQSNYQTLMTNIGGQGTTGGRGGGGSTRNQQSSQNL